MGDNILNNPQENTNTLPIPLKKLKVIQKISLILIIFIAISLPITTFSLFNSKTTLRSKADAPVTPPSSPTPTDIFPTQAPYFIIIPNSSTNKSCNDICSTYELTCSSVGTDPQAADFKSWQMSKNSCVQPETSCSTIMKRTSKKICSDFQSPWTNCKCSE